MKLTYFQHDPPNFGDAINADMWDQLLPEGFLDEDESELFLGAGSILWGHTPKAPIKHVMGSGYGGYSGPPDMHDGSWNVVWLRGPLTAARLGLDPKYAIADAAILLREVPLAPPATGIRVAFMPHFESVARGAWEQACALAGITFLDPRSPPDQVIAAIQGAELVISEAMHGAIVADALRTPWIGVIPFDPAHQMKWKDWAQSLDVELRPRRLWPSSALEAYTTVTGKPGKGARSQTLLQSAVLGPANRAFVHLAAAGLSRLAGAEPQLSRDTVIKRATERSREALDGFVRARLGRVA